jgi:hypothetical protein
MKVSLFEHTKPRDQRKIPLHLFTIGFQKLDSRNQESVQIPGYRIQIIQLWKGAMGFFSDHLESTWSQSRHESTWAYDGGGPRCPGGVIGQKHVLRRRRVVLLCESIRFSSARFPCFCVGWHISTFPIAALQIPHDWSGTALPVTCRACPLPCRACPLPFSLALTLLFNFLRKRTSGLRKPWTKILTSSDNTSILEQWALRIRWRFIRPMNLKTWIPGLSQSTLIRLCWSMRWWWLSLEKIPLGSWLGNLLFPSAICIMSRSLVRWSVPHDSMGDMVLLKIRCSNSILDNKSSTMFLPISFRPLWWPLANLSASICSPSYLHTNGSFTGSAQRGDVEIKDFVVFPHWEENPSSFSTADSGCHDDRKKILHYRHLYADLPVPIVFILVVNWSLTRWLLAFTFLACSPWASALSGELSEESDQFRFLYPAFLTNFKGSVGLILAKASAILVVGTETGVHLFFLEIMQNKLQEKKIIFLWNQPLGGSGGTVHVYRTPLVGCTVKTNTTDIQTVDSDRVEKHSCQIELRGAHFNLFITTVNKYCCTYSMLHVTAVLHVMSEDEHTDTHTHTLFIILYLLCILTD